MKKLIPKFGDARLQSRGDAFTTLARSIVGQQISVKAAQSVWDRFVALVGGPRTALEPGGAGLEVPQLREAGLSARKAEYLLTCRATSRRPVHVASGSRWTTRPSSPSWWPSAASAAGRPRCS
jgi:3-methyladenine DNA glycosylase/8-oxoguanine DNA glycosylase